MLVNQPPIAVMHRAFEGWESLGIGNIDVQLTLRLRV